MAGNVIDVAIIGAGPYGLSIAAHLRARNVAFRIFGTPMSSWRDHMAAGTLLKSYGFASSLYDPGSKFTLAHYWRNKVFLIRTSLLRFRSKRLSRTVSSFKSASPRMSSRQISPQLAVRRKASSWSLKPVSAFLPAA